MAIKFKKYSRFDEDKAANGVAHTLIDELGNNYGTFVTTLFDRNSKFFQVEVERYQRTYSKTEHANGKNANIYAFVQIAIHDWSGVLDEKGKEVPFSKEAAFEYFSDPDMLWVANKLMEQSTDISFYAADPVATKEDDLKN